MYKVNGQPTAEKIQKYNEDKNIWFRFQNPEYEITGEYTQSWGMIYSSAEEAMQAAEDEEWDNPEEAVLPGKSCMPEFEQITD